MFYSNSITRFFARGKPSPVAGGMHMNGYGVVTWQQVLAITARNNKCSTDLDHSKWTDSRCGSYIQVHIPTTMYGPVIVKLFAQPICSDSSESDIHGGIITYDEMIDNVAKVPRRAGCTLGWAKTQEINNLLRVELVIFRRSSSYRPLPDWRYIVVKCRY